MQKKISSFNRDDKPKKKMKDLKKNPAMSYPTFHLTNTTPNNSQT